MKRWAVLTCAALAGLAVSLTLNWVILGRASERLAALDDVMQQIKEEMKDKATTVVTCSNGWQTTVCTAPKSGESDEDYAARHFARVQAFEDACPR